MLSPDMFRFRWRAVARRNGGNASGHEHEQQTLRLAIYSGGKAPAPRVRFLFSMRPFGLI